MLSCVNRSLGCYSEEPLCCGIATSIFSQSYATINSQFGSFYSAFPHHLRLQRAGNTVAVITAQQFPAKHKRRNSMRTLIATLLASAATFATISAANADRKSVV